METQTMADRLTNYLLHVIDEYPDISSMTPAEVCYALAEVMSEIRMRYTLENIKKT